MGREASVPDVPSEPSLRQTHQSSAVHECIWVRPANNSSVNSQPWETVIVGLRSPHLLQSLSWAAQPAKLDRPDLGWAWSGDTGWEGEEKEKSRERYESSEGSWKNSCFHPVSVGLSATAGQEERRWRIIGGLGEVQPLPFKTGIGYAAAPGSLSLGPWQEISPSSGHLHPLPSSNCHHNGIEGTAPKLKYSVPFSYKKVTRSCGLRQLFTQHLWDFFYP